MAKIEVHMKPELYNLVLAEAKRRKCAIYEVFTALAADHFGTPELAKLDKGRPGPKPKPKAVAS